MSPLIEPYLEPVCTPLWDGEVFPEWGSGGIWWENDDGDIAWKKATRNNYDFNTQTVQSPLGFAITEPSLNTLIAMWIVVSPTSG